MAKQRTPTDTTDDLIKKAKALSRSGTASGTQKALDIINIHLSKATQEDDLPKAQKCLIFIYDVYSKPNTAFHQVKRLSARADQKDAVAMHVLGDCYLQGDGVEKDFSLAKDFYHQSSQVLGYSLFPLALNNLYTRCSSSTLDYFKPEAVFKLFASEALKQDRIHTEEFRRCYTMIPDWKAMTDPGLCNRASEIKKRLHECFGGEDQQFLDRICSVIGDRINGHWDTWGLSYPTERWRHVIVGYLPDLLRITLKESPADLHAFMVSRAERFGGFRLPLFSELCYLCNPSQYYVFNRAYLISRMQ